MKKQLFQLRINTDKYADHIVTLERAGTHFGKPLYYLSIQQGALIYERQLTRDSDVEAVRDMLTMLGCPAVNVQITEKVLQGEEGIGEDLANKHEKESM